MKIWTKSKINKEYLENHSRPNNIKLLGVPEDDDENSWDDTELIVKTLIKNKLGIQDEVEIERAHRVGKKAKPRPQSKKEESDTGVELTEIAHQT